LRIAVAAFDAGFIPELIEGGTEDVTFRNPQETPGLEQFESPFPDQIHLEEIE
jgi:hypothetical protein